MDVDADGSGSITDPGHDGTDPLQTTDPWANLNLPDNQAPSFFPQPQSSFSVGAVTAGTAPGPPEQQNGQRANDKPPVWDGKDPYKNLEQYLRMLELWVKTTRTDKHQHGYTILQNTSGSLNEIIYHGLDNDAITSQESGEKVLTLVKEAFSEFLDSKLPQRIEESFYNNDRFRKRDESMITYIARRKDRFKKLQKEGFELPDKAKAYLLYRDATLPERSRELVEMWTQGEYDYEPMQKALKLSLIHI